MTTVTDLAQHLLRLDPQKNVARLALYHFLKNQRNLETPFTAEVLEEFYRRALYFQYWQSQKAELSKTVQQDLISYPGPIGFDLDQVTHAGEMQIVAIEQFKDLQAIVEKYLQQQKTAGEKFRLVRLSEQRIMALHLSAKGDLKVLVFPQLCVIRQGTLIPLAPLTRLYYNAALELEPQREQMLEVSEMVTAHFRLAGQSCDGHFLRGYAFQRAEVFNDLITQAQELFFALKSTERHFINPQSDPFYQELVSVLEHGTHVLKSRHPEALTVATNALKRGRLALKSIFPNDKLLLLLVTNLEFLLNSKSPSQGSRKEEWQKLSPLA